MEYEIGDEPQGLPDRPEGDRDGGLRDDPFFFRRNASPKPAVGPDDADPEDRPVPQMGELA